MIVRLSVGLALLALAGCGAGTRGAQGGAGGVAGTVVAGGASVGSASTSAGGTGGPGGTTVSTTATATSTTAPGTTPTVAPPTGVTVPRPPIHRWPIPYGAARRAQMASYSLRHYGEDTYVLSNPKVIVEHYTETETAQEAYNTFAPDVPDSEFHELPNTCAHFLVEGDGRIDQLVPLNLRCRHTTGLNWTAIGIENVGMSDAQILGDRAQLRASLRLTRWLMCTYGISLRNVIGHNESLSSPYHHDRVPAFQHQTHSDWSHADMNRYRGLLARMPCG